MANIPRKYVLVVIAMMLSELGIGMMIPNQGRILESLPHSGSLASSYLRLSIFPVLNILSSAFMLTSGILFLMYIGFLIFHFTKTGKSITQ